MASPPSNASTGTVLITGGTDSATTPPFTIAKSHPNYHIILASRTDPNNAASSINKATNTKNTTFHPLDLSSPASIRAFITHHSTTNHPHIKILLLNAGLQITAGFQLTSPENHEKTFAINHLGHCLLFYLLRPHLAPSATIILTSSGTHDPTQKTMVPDALYTTAEDLAHPPPAAEKSYDGRQVYATSKLCNVLWTYALHRRLHPPSPSTAAKGRNWSVAAFDPGFMPGTGLARDAPAFQRFLFLSVLPRLLPLLRLLLSPNVHTAAESGGALARLAMGKAGDVGGKYFEGEKEVKSSAASYEVGKQEDLWGWTARALARDEGERVGFEGVWGGF